MLKEKVQGFKYLFSDAELRSSSILSFSCVLVIVLGRFLYNVLPNAVMLVVIGIVALLLFSYYFFFLVFFNFAVVVLRKFRNNRKKTQNKKTLMAIRLLAVAVLLLGNILFRPVWSRLNGTLMFFSFLAWAFIETYFIVKLAYEFSDFTTHRFVRLLLYSLICVGYGLYLFLSFQNAAVPGDDPIDVPFLSGKSERVFDVGLTLVMFFYSFATMGQRFLPKEGFEKLDFEHLSWKQEVKLRNTAGFVFFIVIGFQIFVGGFNFLFNQNLALANDFGYYLVKFIFHVILAALTFFLVLFKKPGEGGKQKKAAKTRGNKKGP